MLIKGEIEKPKLSLLQTYDETGEFYAINFNIFGMVVEFRALIQGKSKDRNFPFFRT